MVKIKDFLEYELIDDDTATGGTSFDGEKVKDFIEEVEISSEEDISVLNNALIECGIEPISNEEILKKDLENAINYYIEYADIDELKEQCHWYRVNNIYMLKNIMYESYLDNYDGEELQERIQDLYE